MKGLGVLAVASLLSVGAMAADNTISATARMGLIVRDNDSTIQRNSSAIEAEFFRMNFDGVLNTSTKYHMVLDPVVANSATDVTTNISSFITELWINRAIGDATNLIVGKQKVLTGSMEYWYATPDVYTYSQFNSAVTGRTAAATLSHKIMGQEFKVQLANGNEDKRTGYTHAYGETGTTLAGAKSQSKFGYSFLYKGSVMDGMIKPILGYTVDPTERAGGADTYLAGGAQVNAAGFTVEAEYDLKTLKKASGTDDKTVSSIVALVRHNGENFQPFVKFIADTKKTASVKTDARTAFDLGLEMKEVKDDSVRYHVVYSSQSTHSTVANVYTKDTAKPSQIYAGVKFTADILK
jgi:hypothetical protein